MQGTALDFRLRKTVSMWLAILHAHWNAIFPDAVVSEWNESSIYLPRD
jgi:hypothetical protein